MTSILAIETSTPACSVALAVGSKRLFRYSEEPRSHTKLIMAMIDEVLVEAGIVAGDLDAIAVTVGPGSFTGLRIGFSTAQGLAFGLDKPVVPISTLQVMAQTFIRRHQLVVEDSLVLMPVLDARMGEFNCGAYRIDKSGCSSALIEDQLLSKQDALALCEELKPAMVVGDGEALFSDKEKISYKLQGLYPDAVDLLELAITDFAQGAAKPVDQVDLVYLRGTEAWKKHTPLRGA